jgi:hypothetical protein
MTPRLRILRGTLAGKEFPLSEAPVVVGRGTECTISVPDSGLSRAHFEISYSDQVFRLTDLGSRNGLTVNRKTVQSAVLRPGDEILAGQTAFRVEGPPAPLFQAATPTLSPEAPASAEGTLLAEIAAAVRCEPPSRLYALIDGAQAFELAFTAHLMGHDLYTIFSGDLADTVAHVGPCLVALGDPSAFLMKWVDRLGSHAGVLLETSADLSALYAHLRAIFVASDEEGQEYFFRFYDPRVLRVFLPTCHEDELKEFFGPIRRWIAEDADGLTLTTYTLVNSRVASRSIQARPTGTAGKTA